MSDRRDRSQTDRSGSSSRTPSGAPSRTRREPSRDREGAPPSTGSASLSLGSDSDRNPRTYPPPAGGRAGSSSALDPTPPVGLGGASSIDLPVYVGSSDTSPSRAELLYESTDSMPGTPPRHPSTAKRVRGGPRVPQSHDLPPSRPTSSNPASPLPGRTGSGLDDDPTASGGSFPGSPSGRLRSTPVALSTVSNYLDHDHAQASQSAHSQKSEDSMYFSKGGYFPEPDPDDDNKHDSFRPHFADRWNRMRDGEG